jgi:hypothetical protein
LHFDPRAPKCTAKVILLEHSGSQKPGTILGDAQLVGETSGHIRLVLGWGDDNQRAGYVARQRTANFLRRESRGVGVGGRAGYTASEERDGIGMVTKIERDSGESPRSKVQGRGTAREVLADGHHPRPALEAVRQDRAEKLAQIEAFERSNKHLFV